MTDRLYYSDPYLREFRAQVVEVSEDGRRVYLNRTAFYPASGGQPFDTGTLGGARVIEVVDEEDRVAHIVEGRPGESEVEGRIDWPRRFDHMQQHTGQHLLSAVLEELFRAPTVSFHMGAATSTIDIAASSLSARHIEQAEERCAEIIREARPVAISFEDSAAPLDLRKPSERTGTLRIITIDGLDRSACGGTHVRSTAEIGALFLRKTEKVRGNLRLEFVCGQRARAQARRDFQTLQEISRQLSTPAEQAPAVLTAQIERASALEKIAQKLTIELARREGGELWAATEPSPDGVRRVAQRLEAGRAIDDAVRTRAQAFVSQGKAIFLAMATDPVSLLLAASPDSGVHAGDRLKAAVNAAGGRGGGNQALAQGSVPPGADLDAIASRLVHSAG